MIDSPYIMFVEVVGGLMTKDAIANFYKPTIVTGSQKLPTELDAMIR